MKRIALALIACAALGFAAGKQEFTPETPAVAVAPPAVEAVVDEPLPEEPSPTFEWVTEKEAKASGKPVLYLATLSKGCAPCAKLKGLMDNPITAEALSHFACVQVVDPPTGHPWIAHWQRHAVRSGSGLKYPFMVFESSKSTPYLQIGAPDDVPMLLQFLDQMEKRAAGKKPATVVPDSSKTFIRNYPTLAPTRPKSSAKPRGMERSVVVRRTRWWKHQ